MRIYDRQIENQYSSPLQYVAYDGMCKQQKASMQYVSEMGRSHRMDLSKCGA